MGTPKLSCQVLMSRNSQLIVPPSEFRPRKLKSWVSSFVSETSKTAFRGSTLLGIYEFDQLVGDLTDAVLVANEPFSRLRISNRLIAVERALPLGRM